MDREYKKEVTEKMLEQYINKDDLTISVHGDADGISSATLLLKAMGRDYDNVKIEFPRLFGDTTFEPDIVLDQAPRDSNYDGLVIDHHDAHWGRDNDYELVYSPQYCASRLVWDSLKDKIPKGERWKVSIGIAGDGGEDEIPPEVFVEAPSLITETGYTYGKNYGRDLDYSAQHAFVLAKSLLNYGTRMGQSDYSMSKLMQADDVFDIVNDNWLRNAKKQVQNEMKDIYKDNTKGKIEVYGYLAFMEYESEYRVWVAQDVYSRTNKTSIAVNSQDGSFSIRGPLAQLIARMLDRIDGISAGGHLSYAGGKLEDVEVDFLRKQIPMLNERWKNEEIE